MGELTIWDTRAQAEQTLGDAFNTREIHDAMLTEGGPARNPAFTDRHLH